MQTSIDMGVKKTTKLNPIGEYILENGKRIFVYTIIKGLEDRIIVGDDFSGRNPRSLKIYSNTKGMYFLYRGIKVYLSDVRSLV